MLIAIATKYIEDGYMMEQIWHSENHQDTDLQPIYNIKAVVEATGLPAATLRAWERRYGALAPRRTESGYRLYSAQDITLLRWLKARVDEGMSISQAIVLLNHRRDEQVSPVTSLHKAPAHSGASGVQAALVDALLGFDERRAELVLEESFALYGVETVFERIVAPTVVQIGTLWHKGQASTAVEHFTSNYLRRKIDAIINAAPQTSTGPLIVMGCAPDDWHEIGLLLIYLMLRRRGLHTIYLGQSVPAAQFVEELARLRPALVIISAATVQTVAGLIDLAQAVEVMAPPRPIFAYGGHVFNVNPDLRQTVPGIFLGESARAAVEYVVALVNQPGVPAADSGTDKTPRQNRN